MAAPELTSRVIVSVVKEPGSGFGDPDRRIHSLDSLVACLVSTRGIRLWGIGGFCLDSKLFASSLGESNSIFEASGLHIFMQWVPGLFFSFWLWNDAFEVLKGCDRDWNPVNTVCKPLDSRFGMKAGDSKAVESRSETEDSELAGVDARSGKKHPKAGTGGFRSEFSGCEYGYACFESGIEASGRRRVNLPLDNRWFALDNGAASPVVVLRRGWSRYEGGSGSLPPLLDKTLLFKRRFVMAAKGQSLAEKFSRWGVTASVMREHLEEMPHVAPDLEEMEQKVSEARGLESQQEAIRGRAREVSAQLLALAKEGDKLRSRLRSHLQAKFGPTSEQLRKFGFAPRQIPRRTRASETPEPEEPAGVSNPQ